jgi:two-component system cell cycle response regulator DivK
MAPHAAPPAPTALHRDARARPKILIVEDDFLNRRLMTDLFEEHGYGTLQAENGHEAIMMARANGPDLIVMDIQLPKLSGLDAVKQLKSDDDLRGIPVIGMSAMARSEADGMIRGAGFDEFLSKPFTVGSMLRTVSRFLH